MTTKETELLADYPRIDQDIIPHMDIHVPSVFGWYSFILICRSPIFSLITFISVWTCWITSAFILACSVRSWSTSVAISCCRFWLSVDIWFCMFDTLSWSWTMSSDDMSVFCGVPITSRFICLFKLQPWKRGRQIMLVGQIITRRWRFLQNDKTFSFMMNS